MSKTYSIACKQCKVHLWIGQGQDKMETLYTNKNTIFSLKLFLNSHRMHELIFDENCDSSIGDFVEIDVLDEDPPNRELTGGEALRSDDVVGQTRLPEQDHV